MKKQISIWTKSADMKNVRLTLHLWRVTILGTGTYVYLNEMNNKHLEPCTGNFQMVIYTYAYVCKYGIHAPAGVHQLYGNNIGEEGWHFSVHWPAYKKVKI